MAFNLISHLSSWSKHYNLVQQRHCAKWRPYYWRIGELAMVKLKTNPMSAIHTLRGVALNYCNCRLARARML